MLFSTGKDQLIPKRMFGFISRFSGFPKIARPQDKKQRNKFNVKPFCFSYLQATSFSEKLKLIFLYLTALVHKDSLHIET